MMSMSRTRGALCAGCAALCATLACAPSATKLRSQYDGTLGLSTDGKLLYTANADTGDVTVVDATTRQVVTHVTVGERPARIAVAPDDTLYVTNRGSRSVSIVHRGIWTEAARIPVGAEPIGLALSNDGATLYVVSSASATLDAFDVSAPTPTHLWQAALSDEPRNVAVLADGRLYVTHYKSGTVDVLDASGNVKSSISTAVGVDPASAGSGLGAPLASLPAFRPTALDSIVVSPDGNRAYLVHRRERQEVLGAGDSSTPIVVPALTTLDISSNTAIDDAKTGQKDFPPPVIFPGGSSAQPAGGSMGGPPHPTPFGGGGSGSSGGGSSAYGVSSPPPQPWSQGPVAAVEDPRGQFLYVANENSDDVTVLSPTSRTAQGTDNGVLTVVPVGSAPTGIALGQDEQTLYVHNSLDYSVSFVQRQGGQLVEVARVTVSTPGNLPADAVEGRRLFFSAADPAMTVPGGGIACESCHLEGGNDGNVWQFEFGPRKTPSLLGRRIQDTAPYHWDGTEDDFSAFFAETVQVRMGGLGVSQQQSNQITTYLQGLGTPDNPFRQPGGLTPAQQAGKTLFEGKAMCIACHSGPDFTDNGFHDVGTLVTSNPGGKPDDPCRLDPSMGSCAGTTASAPTTHANLANTDHGFNTPSLLGVVWAAPYLHSGAAATLRDRLTNNPGDRHGHTSDLSSGEIDDLVQYLQTL